MPRSKRRCSVLVLKIKSAFKTSFRGKAQKMTNTKFVVKVNRGGSPQYVKRLDRTPIVMTSDRKLALLMGKLTAEDAVLAIQNSRCTAELVSVELKQKSRSLAVTA